jgi:hypothetical protein
MSRELDELLDFIKSRESPRLRESREKTLDSESLSGAFIKAGKATCKVKQVTKKGWFEMSAEEPCQSD